MKPVSLLLALILCVLPLLASAETASRPSVPSWKDIPTGIFPTRVAVHDPSVIAADGQYYIFGTHMTAVGGNESLWGVRY